MYIEYTFVHTHGFYWMVQFACGVGRISQQCALSCLLLGSWLCAASSRLTYADMMVITMSRSCPPGDVKSAGGSATAICAASAVSNVTYADSCSPTQKPRWRDFSTATPSSLQVKLQGWRACPHVDTPSRAAPPVGRHQLPQGSSTYLQAQHAGCLWVTRVRRRARERGDGWRLYHGLVVGHDVAELDFGHAAKRHSSHTPTRHAVSAQRRARNGEWDWKLGTHRAAPRSRECG